MYFLFAVFIMNQPKLPKTDRHVIVGNLFSNPAKLMVALWKHGVIKGNDNKRILKKILRKYRDIEQITRAIFDFYSRGGADLNRRFMHVSNDEQYKKALAEYTDLVEKLRFNDETNFHIHLLGNHLADRGANDYLMLHSLVSLNKHCSQLTVIHSNHVNDFFYPNIKGILQNPDGMDTLYHTMSKECKGEELIARIKQMQSFFFLGYSYHQFTDQQKAIIAEGIRLNTEKSTLIEQLTFPDRSRVVLTHAIPTFATDNHLSQHIEKMQAINLNLDGNKAHSRFLDLVPLEDNSACATEEANSLTISTRLDGATLSLCNQYGRNTLWDRKNPISHKDTAHLGTVEFNENGVIVLPLQGNQNSSVSDYTKKHPSRCEDPFTGQLKSITNQLIAALEDRYYRTRHRFFSMNEERHLRGQEKIKRIKSFLDHLEKETQTMGGAMLDVFEDQKGLLENYKTLQLLASIKTGATVSKTKSELLLERLYEKNGIPIVRITPQEKECFLESNTVSSKSTHPAIEIELSSLALEDKLTP